MPAHRNDETADMPPRADSRGRQLSESTTLLHSDLQALHADAGQARTALEREYSEAPTREHHDHPCAALLAHVQDLKQMAREVSALRAYLVSATIGVLISTCTVAGWLLLRGDGIADRLSAANAELAKGATERAIAIGVLQTRQANAEASLSRLEAGLGKVEGKLDALLASRSQPVYTVP